MSCEQTSCLIFFIFAKRNFIDEEIHTNNITILVFADKTQCGLHPYSDG